MCKIGLSMFGLRETASREAPERPEEGVRETTATQMPERAVPKPVKPRTIKED